MLLEINIMVINWLVFAFFRIPEVKKYPDVFKMVVWQGNGCADVEKYYIEKQYRRAGHQS